MSTIESCLDSKGMATASVDFLESFKTVDEEKDSDEESFHLFLDGDDELNKSDEKVDDDANKNNDEEKEKVNEPTVEENECNTENNSSNDEDKKQEINNEKRETQETNSEKPETQETISEKPETQETNSDKPEIQEINSDNTESDHNNAEKISNNDDDCVILTENVTAEPENTEETVVVNTENVEEKKQKDENSSNEEASIPNNTNEIEPMVIDPRENDEKPVQEKESHNENEIKSNSVEDSLMESEDDILNKHETEITDLEDLDPTLEERLLDENDDVPEIEKGSNESDVSNLQMSVLEDAEASAPEVKSKNVEVKEVEKSDSGSDQNKTDLAEEGEAVKKKGEAVKKKGEPESVTEKCDNSNGSHSDTEDLLDISMIKDSAQDDADIAEDALQLEKENEDMDCSTTNESKRTERIGSVDSSNLENSDEDGKGYCSESQEASENLQTDCSDVEKDKELHENEDDKEETEDDKDENEVDKEEIVCDKEENLEEPLEEPKQTEELCKENESLHIDSSPVRITNDDENSNKDKTATKRTLSEDIPESEPKKLKLDEGKILENNTDHWDITELSSLISFSKFMTKSHLKRLTRADLEEFCVQKLCEAILNKSELGETNHQLKIQEQTIEALRKEQSILTKQIKDLEIVNKKLMHEVKTHIGLKPIVPVKITRSVGLQVRMTQANEVTAAKRRSTQATPQKAPTQNQVNNRSPRIAQAPTVTVNRQVFQKTPQKSTAPLLTQVLQNRNRPTVKTNIVQNNTPVRSSPKVKVAEKRVRTSGSFIDLTDEDDKRINANAKNQNALKTIVPQGVRINTVPKTTISSVLPSVVSQSTPQVMYVVQSNSQIKQGLLTTPAGQQKAVLVNFQQTNGVISSLNTSSVSVIPKVTPNNVPLKTVSSLVKMKHPAPLPNPPLVQGVNNKSLKAIPPKPHLSIRKTNTGIILQWRMPYDLGLYEIIASYQLYAYQETLSPPSTDMWRKVGDVKAMALPMACTLTQFLDKNKYYFAVRPVDVHKRIGLFSDPEEISL